MAGGVLMGVIALASVVAGPVQAANDPDGYQGDKKGVQVAVAGPTTADGKTTSKFTLTTNGENVSHVLLVPCPGVSIDSVTGPPGAKKESGEPKADPSLEGDQHIGIKFEPGLPGDYTLVYAGPRVEFIVKDGNGHMHWSDGSGSCEPQTQTPSTPSGEQPNQPSQPNQPDNPNVGGAGNQNNQPGAAVQGSTATSAVPPFSASSRPPRRLRGATLPRAGLPVSGLASIGTLLLGLGGLTTALGRWPRG